MLPKEDSSERRSSNRDARQEAPQTSAGAASDAGNPAAPSQKKAEDYAATGIGRRTQHEVQWVNMELESTPVATINLRYEFRPVLVSMGILPALPTAGRIVEKGTGARIYELLPRTAVEGSIVRSVARSHISKVRSVVDRRSTSLTEVGPTATR